MQKVNCQHILVLTGTLSQARLCCAISIVGPALSSQVLPVPSSGHVQ